MQVYAGFIRDYPGLIFMPGKFAEMDDVTLNPAFMLDVLPDASVHRILMAELEEWEGLGDGDDEVPGSAFSIKYECTNPDHDHYGETGYAVVIQGVMESTQLSLEAVNGFMDDLKKLYPLLQEQEVI